MIRRWLKVARDAIRLEVALRRYRRATGLQRVPLPNRRAYDRAIRKSMWHEIRSLVEDALARQKQVRERSVSKW